MKKSITAIVICLLCASVVTLSACNTVHGVGKDIAQGGQDIERASR